MPKLSRFKKAPRSALMGAGAVLDIQAGPAHNPALRDALALQRDMMVVAEDLWGAVAVFDAASKPPSHPGKETRSKQDE